MGWIFAIIMFVMGCKSQDAAMLITSGLFAIAGAIAFAKR